MSPDEPERNPSTMSRHTRWILLTLIFVTLLGSIITSFLHITARQPMVGTMDRKTGHRYTYTVAAGWHQTDRPKNIGPSRDSMETVYFGPPKPSPLQEWIEHHLLQKKPSPVPSFLETTIHVESVSEESLPSFELHDGYPSLHLPKTGVNIPFTILEEKHIIQSGQPATWYAVRVGLPSTFSPPGSTVNNGYTYYAYAFLIKVKNTPLWYEVVGHSDEAHHLQVRNEAWAIGKSLRIEKANGK